jgi:glycosyltransferase involved in cell wall biosynthesis
MLTKASINRLYTRYKRWSAFFLRRGHTETGVDFLRLAANVGYTFNLRYTDEAVEDSIDALSRRFTPNPVSIDPQQGSVVFYDTFAMDNRGLTQQYLHALVQLGYTIHYIVPHDSIGADIRSFLESTKGATITTLTHKRFRENLEAGLNAIQAARPSTVFQHMGPDDILGCCLCLPVTGCTRYRINLTDHAYWVGTRCSDYWIEFRRYGAWLSHHHRKLPLERLLLQPYYPIAVEKPFEGFPATVTPGKTLLFAGATYYKLYGNNHRFLHLIRKVLEDHPDTQFLLAGDGNDAPLHQFIHRYHLENRIILLGSRRDITEVFRHIDIYINTYPMIGGLMSQLAALCHKPVIGYTDEALYSFNDTEDLMGLPSTGNLVVTHETDFQYRLHRLITDPAYRNDMAAFARKTLPTPKTFTKQLEQLLNTPQPLSASAINNIRINLDTVSAVYIDMENNYQHQRRYFARIKPLKILLKGFHLLIKDAIPLKRMPSFLKGKG